LPFFCLLYTNVAATAAAAPGPPANFGTGYRRCLSSSLAGARDGDHQFFIRGPTDDATSGAITRAAADLGHKLSLAVVAEGIEDAATWQWARDDEIDFGQGYYLARPVPAEQVRQWFKTPMLGRQEPAA
jgi:predicted signal transduction protein with EAL and GGDEF domain